jgi:hypothetical protein
MKQGYWGIEFGKSQNTIRSDTENSANKYDEEK